MSGIDVDVAVVGSGFAGTLTAMALAARGRRVALVERGTHPRFAIGESTTPLTNLLLEELADRYGLSEVRAFAKWGTWQQARPDVACGLKRGFSFLFHDVDRAFVDTPDHDRSLLVAASPHDAVADTHWYRPDFDHALVRMAQQAGVLYTDQSTITCIEESPHGQDGIRIHVDRAGSRFTLSAGFLVDASGPRGAMLGAGLVREVTPRWLPATAGLYAHFSHVRPWDDLAEAREPTPFPRDDAALHHVFPGGWIWVLRFNNGLTSAGASLTAPLAAALETDVRNPEGLWARLLARLPSVRAQFAHARATRPFVYTPRLAFRCDRVTGANWAMLPSAAGVIDPLLSTGFPLTLLGVLRLLDLLEHTAPGAERSRRLDDYARATQSELDITEQLVAALFGTMDDPDLFRRLTLLYFAAASFAEAARRLGRPHLAPGFLLHEHPDFGPRLRACAAAARAHLTDETRRDLLAAIDRAIAPLDTAGLGDRARRHWYPMRAADLIEGAPKLGATRAEIDELLARCGLAGPAVRPAD